MNEQLRQVADGFAVEDTLQLVCECERGDCVARVSVSVDAYEAVRRFPTRFLVNPEHVGADERIVEEAARFAVVEKVGSGAETAILQDPRKRASDIPRSGSFRAHATEDAARRLA